MIYMTRPLAFMFALAIAFGLSVFSLTPAKAQLADVFGTDGNFYIGVSAIIDADSDYSRTTEDGLVESQFEYGAGWVLAFGYQLTDIIGGEIEYARAQDIGGKRTVGDDEVSSKADFAGASVLLRYPADRYSPYARLGWSQADIEARVDGVPIDEPTDGGWFGVGLDILFSNSDGGLRFEYNVAEYEFDTNFETTVERFQFGALVRF